MTISQDEFHRLTTTAIAAARAGAKELQKYAQQSFHVHNKDSSLNLVTEADLKSEEAVFRTLQQTFPSHQILSEESGLHISHDSPFKWIIDPLDGTTNFAHGFLMYNVSIGLEYDGTCLVGVVYDPTRDELFVAKKDQGATLNATSIHVSDTPRLDQGLLVTGFAYDVHTDPDNNLKEFSQFTLRARGIRRTGSAALDLCYVACGRFDGFWELKLHPWDTAAGKLIVEEARGKVTTFSGTSYSIYGKDIVASNGHIHQEMVSTLQEVRS